MLDLILQGMLVGVVATGGIGLVIAGLYGALRLGFAISERVDARWGEPWGFVVFAGGVLLGIGLVAGGVSGWLQWLHDTRR